MEPQTSSQHFFLQAEDGIRGGHVTGVRTCALPISATLLDSAGRLVAESSKVAESSGYSALDSAALEDGRASGRERRRMQGDAQQPRIKPKNCLGPQSYWRSCCDQRSTVGQVHHTSQ